MARESDLLRHIYERSAHLAGHPHIVLGPGDDAAWLHLPAGLLITVDQLVEGRHYPPELELDLVARKAVARSVSDIAAMGGRPLAGLATGCLRPDFAHADHLFDRLAHWARHWNAPLAGGDIASGPGPHVLTVTILGHLPEGATPVSRSGARPGDRVIVTGALGGSFASGRHATFEPRVEEAAWLLAHARPTAMMDLSDGLGRDAMRIAQASGVRLVIEAERLPRHAEVTDWRPAASEGEDYELLFTLPADVAASLPATCPTTGTAFTAIGDVIAPPHPDAAACTILASGVAHDASSLGWDHG